MAPKQAKSCGVKKKAPKACGVKKEATVDARRKTKKQPAVAAQDDDWDELFATAGPKTLEEVDQWPQQNVDILWLNDSVAAGDRRSRFEALMQYKLLVDTDMSGVGGAEAWLHMQVAAALEAGLRIPTDCVFAYSASEIKD